MPNWCTNELCVLLCTSSLGAGFCGEFEDGVDTGYSLEDAPDHIDEAFNISAYMALSLIRSNGNVGVRTRRELPSVCA